MKTIAATSDADPRGSDTIELAPFAARPVLGMAAATVVVMTAVSWLYGYHRDELYYLWGGEHLAWGYVDHPPLVPLVAHLADVVGGHTLVGLRAVAALVAGWLVVAGALMARELGGRRRAQIIAAFAVLAVPATRGPAALYGTTAADGAVWAILLLLFIRLLRTRNTRLWLWIGLVVGIGLETKWSVLILVGGMVVALAVGPGRRLLWSPWTLVGGLIALAWWVPNLWWNATHDWAFLEFQRSVADQNGDLGLRLLFVPLLVLLGGVAPVIVWVPGWRWLVREPRFRALGVGAVVMTVAVLLGGGKPYYLAPLYVLLLAAGAVVLDRATDRWRRTCLWVLAIGGLISVPLTMPLLPPRALGAVKPINKELSEMVGWPELTAQARSAFASLDPDEQAHTIILTDNYGTAGALNRDAPELPVHSAHNSLWFDGPPPATATTVITVGYRLSSLRWCGSTQQIGVISNSFDVPNVENGRPIIACRRLSEPWPDLWRDLKRFD